MAKELNALQIETLAFLRRHDWVIPKAMCRPKPPFDALVRRGLAIKRYGPMGTEYRISDAGARTNG